MAKRKSFADDGWAIWVTGEDTSTFYLNEWVNPQGKSYVDVARKAQVIGYARMMRRTIRRNGLNTPDGQELIALCKQRLSELLPQVEQLHY